jgi:predicted MFS family arabinose efflux permease
MPPQPALNALNFFMADVRDGLGPFLGVYLQSEKWSPSQIGLVMTIGALAGMAATAPLGALVDRIRAKRAMIAMAAMATVLASTIIVFAPGFAVTAVSQSITGMAGAAIAPAIAGITLGLVKQEGYAHQIGRNESFNHAGNVVAAILAGVLGYIFGIGAVFGVMAAMALTSLVSAWFIDPNKIDHRAARGLSANNGAIRRQTGLTRIARSPLRMGSWLTE